MVDASSQGIVGVSIRETTLRLTEISRANGEAMITRLAQGRVRAPLQITSFKDRLLIHKLAEDVNRLYEVSDFQARRAVFTLDSNAVLIKKIPVDMSLKGSRLKDHVDWEVEQCVINSLTDYHIAYEYYEPGAGQEFAEVVVVIVRKMIVDFLKEIFHNTDLRLRAVDVDVFAAQRVVEANYDFAETPWVALVDVRRENLQFSLLQNARFFAAQEVEYPLEDQSDVTNMDRDFLPRIISKELRRIVLENKLGKGVDELNAIFVYGDHVTDRLVEALQNSHNVRIDRANPFRRLKTAPVVGDLSMQENPETFVVSVGAALKKL